MTDNHPIIPTTELFKQWQEMPRGLAFEAAYRAGADQELEACCKWLATLVGYGKSVDRLLRAARRPKPLSDKEQALEALERINRHIIQQMRGYVIYDELKTYANTILKALEALND